MHAQDILPGLKAWFEDYTGQFSSDDPIVQEAMDLKAEHTLRVCDAIMDIGGTLALSGEELCMVEAAGLLHDIGRFEQYRRYRTFLDYRSEDHAALGVKVIKSHRVLRGLEPGAADMLMRLVGYHNRATLPSGEQEAFLFFLKLLRDADKVDIWRVLTEYYRNMESHRNPAIELDFPDSGRISKPVYEALLERRPVQIADLKTLQDFKLFQIGWIYDVHFPRTFQIVRENRYLEILFDTLPQESKSARQIYARARAYLEAKG